MNFLFYFMNYGGNLGQNGPHQWIPDPFLGGFTCQGFLVGGHLLFSMIFFIKFLPSLFILNCITNIIIQIGFIFFIFPGIFLSILLALSPIILSFQKHTLIESIRSSVSISWKYINIIGTAVLFWMSIKFFLTKFLLNIHLINKDFIFLILNINTNIFFSILIIYLFRFYMLFLRV